MLLDKINELETIVLGKEVSNPAFAWLKVKFDYLRVLATSQQSVQRTAYGRTVWAYCFGFISGLLACLLVIGSR